MKGAEFFQWLVQNVAFLMVTGKVVLLPHVASNSVLVCASSSEAAGYDLCHLYTVVTTEPEIITSKEQLLAKDVIKESAGVCVSCGSFYS